MSVLSAHIFGSFCCVLHVPNVFSFVNRIVLSSTQNRTGTNKSRTRNGTNQKYNQTKNNTSSTIISS
jgi:hypothetical protein